MHTSLDSIVNLSVTWSINSFFVDFWPKIDFEQVRCGHLIESNKHFGNNSPGCWLGYGGGCLMQTIYSENHWECFRLALLLRWSSY